MGYVAIGCSGIHLFINMIFIILESAHQICLRYSRWRLMRKYARVRGEQMMRQEKKQRELKFISRKQHAANKLKKKNAKTELA